MVVMGDVTGPQSSLQPGYEFSSGNKIGCGFFIAQPCATRHLTEQRRGVVEQIHIVVDQVFVG